MALLAGMKLQLKLEHYLFLLCIFHFNLVKYTEMLENFCELGDLHCNCDIAGKYLNLTNVAII